MTLSLRTRIAGWYAALIVVVVILAAIAIDFAFRQLLLDQARLRIAETGDEIARLVDSTAALGFTDVPPIVTLTDRANLDHWASPTTFVQVDDLSGNVVGKSSNMGSLRLPPLHGIITGAQYAVQHTSAGDMVVEDRVLYDAARPLAIAHVAESLAIIDRVNARARVILIVVALAAGLFVVMASYVIAAQAIDPIVRLTAAIAGIASDRLDRRLRWQGRRDEVGRLAEAFDAMLARLQEAFARERQFVSDASHELKTPLTVINANAQMLRRWGDRDPAVLHESLDAIAAESARLAGIVNGMLVLSKAEAGDDIEKEPVSLEAVVADAVESARARADAKGLALRYERNGKAGIVAGAPGLLRQLAGNLIDNAIKFTDSGSIEVGVRHAGDRAVLEVADTGVGIDTVQAERLFDRFFRGDPSHARVVEGQGLGLAIVRSIARVHGGTVTAAPRSEGGSLFSVSFPVVPDHIEPQ